MNIQIVTFIFLLCCGCSISDEGKKRQSESKDFVPSNEWKEIKEGQKVPSGLHYRINLSTGKKEAKIIKEDEKQDDSTGVSIQHNIEDIIKDVNTKNPENDMPKKFRTLDEIKQDLGDIKLEPKSDVEVLQGLFKRFEEESKKKPPDNNIVLNILQDLKYLAHQIDNGNEFCKMDGFRKIIYKELNSTNTVIKQETLKLFSALAQNNPKVKIHILETGGITTLLRILSLEESASLKKSALTALSCTLRTFPYAQNKFIEIGGLTIFSELFKEESLKLKLKMVTLLNDLIVERQKDSMNFKNHDFIDVEETLYSLNWCQHLSNLLHDLVLVDINDLDSIEKCLLAMESMSSKCSDSYDIGLVSNLHDKYITAAKESIDDTKDYFNYLSELTSSLINKSYNSKKDEL